MLTDEQQEVVDLCCSDIPSDTIIAVEAVAGSGKSATAKAVIETYQPKNGYYTAFNKSVVTDGNKKFGDLIPCKTLHALAYKYANTERAVPTDMIITDIKEHLTYSEKYKAIRHMDEFFRSRYTNLDDYLEEVQKKFEANGIYDDHNNDFNYLNERTKNVIYKYADYMLLGKLNPSFNFLLKSFHLMLTNGLNCEFDLFVLDECQDVTNVTFEIFKLIKAKRKLILGDSYQNIYSFMKTINAFEILNKDKSIPIKTLHLTKSFRCIPAIAELVEGYGHEYLNENFRFKGNEHLPIISESNKTTAILTRSNATLIEQIAKHIAEQVPFKLIRDTGELFGLPLAIEKASFGEQVTDRRFKFLNQLKLETFWPVILSADWLDLSVRSMAKIVKSLHNSDMTVKQLLEKVLTRDKPRSCKHVLSTIHTYKGLESDEVTITSDMKESLDKLKIARLNNYKRTGNSISMIRNVLDTEDIETLNVGYVGISRAKYSINTSGVV